MAKPRIARIHAGSVGRHRILGRTEDGINIEEKICPIRGEVFMDRSGGYMHHPLENGRIPSEDGRRAGMATKEEGIKEAGWLPQDECPYTERYRHLVNGPLVQPPEGEKDCGGKPGGCEHWWAVQKRRAERSAQEADRRNAPKKGTDAAGAAAIVKLGQSLERQFMAMAGSAPSIEQTRGRLRKGKGEDADGRLQE